MAGPQLVRGASEATIDQANIAMRGMPWYQQLMRSFGQDPGHPTLTDAQRQQVLRGAQANGFVVDEGNMEMDDHGNFNPVGHKLRNTLIVAGMAAATIATMGAAGAFSGAAATGMAGGAAGGAASGAASAGATAAGLGVTAGGIGTGGLVGSGLTATSLGLGTTAGLGTAGALGAGAGTAAAIGGGAAATGAGLAGVEGGAAAGGEAGAGAFDAAGNFIGDTTYGVGGTTGASGIGKYLDAAGDVSSALGGLSDGRAAGRLAETNANSAYDRAQQDQYRTQVQANQNENQFGLNLADETLKQKQFQLAAPGARAHNAVRGDILSNAHDVSIGGLPAGVTVPTIAGGLRPSMFTAPTHQLGADMTAQALAGQQAGDAYALPTYKPNPLAPGNTPPVAAGKTDSILNTAGTVGTLASMLAKYYR